MSATLIAIVGLIYAAIAVSELYSGNHGLALVFASYAMANVGLIMVSA